MSVCTNCQSDKIAGLPCGVCGATDKAKCKICGKETDMPVHSCRRNITDTDRMNWLCDKAKVYAIRIQTQPHGEILHGELRASIDAAMTSNRS